MPELDSVCGECGHHRYWVERSDGAAWKRCTECDNIIERIE